jgi:hypothetical protein
VLVWRSHDERNSYVKNVCARAIECAVGSKDTSSVFCNLLLSDQFSSGFLSPRLGASSALPMDAASKCVVPATASVFSKEGWASDRRRAIPLGGGWGGVPSK